MPTSREYAEQDMADSMFNDPDFADTDVIWYPGGDVRQQQPIPGAKFDDSQDEGTNQVSGDGRVLTDHDGKRIRSSAILDLPRSFQIDTRLIVVTLSPQDTFFARSKLWSYRRPLGTDSARQTILIVRVEGDYSTRSRLQPR